MPFVSSIKWRIGLARAGSRIWKNSGCSVRSPPETCTTSGSPSLQRRHQACSRSSRERDAAYDRVLVGVADRATQIAEVRDFDQGDAGMLLVIGTEPSIVGAAPPDWGTNHRHFRRIDKNFAAAAVIVDVVGEKDAFGAMSGATLEHEDLPSSKTILPRSCGNRRSRW